MIDQEDYPRAAKQDTQRLGDVARVCRDYVTAMRVAVAAAEIAEVAEAAAVAVAVEREHPNDD